MIRARAFTRPMPPIGSRVDVRLVTSRGSHAHASIAGLVLNLLAGELRRLIAVDVPDRAPPTLHIDLSHAALNCRMVSSKRFV